MSAAHDVIEPGPDANDRWERVFDGDLGELARLDRTELSELYARGRVPGVEALDGKLSGRMLAGSVLPGPLEKLVLVWAGSRTFPWSGKSFRPLATTVGRGVNRVGPLSLFPFVTEIGPSRADDGDALLLDYDLPENPFFIRSVKDEMRELRPGLWLGRAYVELGGAPRFVLFFGISSD